jgi:hypothetical protein
VDRFSKSENYEKVLWIVDYEFISQEKISSHKGKGGYNFYEKILRIISQENYSFPQREGRLHFRTTSLEQNGRPDTGREFSLRCTVQVTFFFETSVNTAGSKKSKNRQEPFFLNGMPNSHYLSGCLCDGVCVTGEARKARTEENSSFSNLFVRNLCCSEVKLSCCKNGIQYVFGR